jgi:hypothetical protein
MTKKAASLKKQLADAIKLILVITSLASIAVFLSSLGFHKTESRRAGRTTTTWDWEWAEKTGDFFGTTPLAVSIFSFIAIVVSSGLAIFIHLKISPEDKELEDLFGTLPKKEETETKQEQTPQDPAPSPVFKFIIWILVILFVCLAVLAIWTEV